MKSIDWNKMSELGLIERINTEIMHPLGLAISRDPETGVSNEILISPDLLWEYGPDRKSTILPEEVVRQKIKELNED